MPNIKTTDEVGRFRGFLQLAEGYLEEAAGCMAETDQKKVRDLVEELRVLETKWLDEKNKGDEAKWF